MAVTVRTVSGPLDDDARLQAIYDGTLLIFKNVEPMLAVCAFADGLAREVLGREDPVTAQFDMEREDYLGRVEALQKRFRSEGRTKTLLRRALEATGVDPLRSAWDRPFLRVSPHGDDHVSRRTQPLGFHRDTWASNVYSQDNWWAPTHPITAGRTIAFYPQYWEEPVPNTSASWDLDEVMAGRTSSLTPEPAVAVSTAAELRVVIEPGDLLCFSGAHLHASIPNTTGIARISIEVRTADVESEATGRGAPNLDGEAPHVALRWFRRMDDDTALADVLARRRLPGPVS